MVVTNSYLCAVTAVFNCPLQHYDFFFFAINVYKLARDINYRKKSELRLKSIKDKEGEKICLLENFSILFNFRDNIILLSDE